jgi:hypothetical protein
MPAKPLEYKIAIPSYRRSELLVTQTIQTLKTLGNDLSNVTVFTANDEETLIYRTVLEAANIDVSVVTGVPGLLSCRKWYYSQYYKEGERVVSLDDDIAGIYQKLDENKLAPYKGTFEQIVQRAYAICEENDVRLWGINAAFNGLFLKPTLTIGLRYCCGIMFGGYAGDPAMCGADRGDSSSGEDFELTLRHFKRYGKVARIDALTCKTKYFNPGGMQAELGGKAERDEHHRLMLNKIAEQYPDLAKVYDKAGGVANIRLKTVTEAKIVW